MESLVVPKLNAFDNLSLDHKMCCSPTSNFGNDFNIIIQAVLDHKRYENSMMEGKSESQKPNGETVINHKQKLKIKVKLTKIDDNDIEVESVCNAKPNNDGKKKDSKGKEKKKKWKTIPMENMGFNFSLFPRPVNDNFKISENEHKLFYDIEEEYEKFEAKCAPFEKLQDFEGCISGNEKYLRADRDRKVRKVHKEIKDKYCKNVKNNKGRKTLYIHHRLSKLITLDVQSLSYLPCTTKNKGSSLVITNKNNPPINSGYKSSGKVAPVAKPQCLAYALDNHNVPGDFDNQVANLLISIQHRDLTPEDYDLLLRLDERVKPKTLDESLLAKFKTDKVENNDNCEMCPICMELYQIGQIRKYLPCDHVFHCDCIEMWLKNSSMNCPIDNLPIEPS